MPSVTAPVALRDERVFGAVLVQDVPWRRFAGSALCATALLGVLLAAVATGARHAVKERELHVDPVVSFLDVPKIESRTTALPNGAAGGAAGAANELMASGSTLAHTKAKAAPPKAERVAPLVDHARATVADEAPRDQAATPAPVSHGGEGRANEGPSQAAAAAPIGAGAANALGSGAGGGGGAGTGNGNGVGSGVGAGVQTANGGRFGVLPFGEGMSRPVLQSHVDPTYTREAVDARVGGIALLKCVLTEAGSVRDCRIVKGLAPMNDAILAAVSKWRYSPVTYQGHAVSVEYLITLHLTPP